MTSEERFRRIDSLLGQALRLEEARRAAFLDEACGNDRDLRREVEALLDASRSAGSFLNRPAMEAVARSLADTAAPLVGRNIGPYPVVAFLGAGGMGEVYRARDVRLGRDVAVKVLPPHLANDNEALARFEREARAVAALSHPNILSIHDFGTDGGRMYAVMECLDGETLRARLDRGPIAWRKSVAIARQIAEGLGAAHAKGIVHRDLKPENIFLVASGVVKILDFGLARVPEGALPTAIAAAATSPGAVMGTTGYMSPEQVRGEEAGPPSDIFSFGCVLFEMIAGAAPFARPTPAETTAAILRDDAPSIRERVGEVPPDLDSIVAHCLEKQPSDRFQSAKDMTFALQAAGGATSGPVPQARSWLQRRAFLIGLGLTTAAAIAGVLTAVILRESAPSRAAAASRVRFTFSPPGAWTTTELENQSIAAAPDGSAVAFIASTDGRRFLWLRARDAVSAVRMNGSEGAAAVFWSPDSRSLAFLADGVLKRVEAAGGPPQTIARVPLTGGSGTWNSEGTILLGGLGETSGSIFSVSINGGSPAPVTMPDASKGDTEHFWPTFLPDGRHFLYLSNRLSSDDHTLYLGSLDGGAARALGTLSSRAEFIDGNLLYVREGSLVSQPFDPVTGRFTGSAQPLADLIQYFSPTGFASFSGSRDLLAYVSGTVVSRLVWYDRSGRETGTMGPLADHEDVRFSPDGQRVATSIGDPRRGTRDVWIYDVAGGTRVRFTTTDSRTEYNPVWSPDGRALAFAADLSGPPSLHRKALQDAGDPQPLLPPSSVVQWTNDWSPDGRFVAYEQTGLAGHKDVRLLPLGETRRPIVLLQSPFNESQARFSPDSRWLAYSSDESGQSEIYVRSLTDPPQKWQVSYAGGSSPVWRRDGRELFYLSGDNHVTAVPVRPGREFSPGTAAALFRVDPAGSGTPFDATDDGGRFLVNTNVSRAETLPLTVVVGWTANPAR
jgi:serine/threonine protein kinase/Tol biopolymer transport system component